MNALIHTPAGLFGMQRPEKLAREPSARPVRPVRDPAREAREYRDLTGKVWYSSLGCSD